VPRAAQALAPRAWQLVPRYRGIGSEAYLNGTSQVPTPEDARKDGHTRGRSRRFMKYPGWVKWKDHNELSYLQGK